MIWFDLIWFVQLIGLPLIPWILHWKIYILNYKLLTLFLLLLKISISGAILYFLFYLFFQYQSYLYCYILVDMEHVTRNQRNVSVTPTTKVSKDIKYVINTNTSTSTTDQGWVYILLNNHLFPTPSLKVIFFPWS